MNTDVNCNSVKVEEDHEGNDHHHHSNQNHHRPYQQTHHRPSSDWSDVGEFDYVYDKIKHQHEHLTSSMIGNDNIDGLSNYSACVSSNSLDTSSGLNGAYSALDLNNSNGRLLLHQSEQQQQQPSFHTCVDNNDASTLHSRQQQQQQQQSHVDYLSSSSSQSVSPVVAPDQEQAKLERKRLRNRLAASLCRKRKLEKISTLESRVQLVKNQNVELLTSIKKCQEQLTVLKKELMQHAKHGCNIPQSFQILS